MKKSEKEKLIEVYFKMDRKRMFDENSMFELYCLVSEAIEIVEKEDKNSDCFKNLLKSQQIWNDYKKIPANQITQTIINTNSMSIIQLSQYSIKNFADKC